MTQLTADDVLNKKFQPTKFREGYDQDEVDEFLDQIVEAMRDLENENAELKAKLDAANARVAELSEGAPVVTATPVSPVAPVAPVVESPIVETPKIEPGGNNAESAAAMLEMAQRLHDEYVAKGKAERERIVTEARATGEQLTREAENQRNQTLSQLEKERANLEHKIDELRRFESDYRTRLRSYLTNLLNNVEDASGGGQSNLAWGANHTRSSEVGRGGFKTPARFACLVNREQPWMHT